MDQITNISPPSIFDRYPEIRVLYLKHLARYGVKVAAAAHIRCSTKMVDAYASRHPDFKEQEKQALGIHAGDIEEVIRERAMEGVEEPKFSSGGKLIGYVTRFSDTLLLAYARRHIPEYREKSERSVENKHTVEVEHKVDLAELTDEQRDALRLLLGNSDDEEQPDEVVKPVVTVEPVGDPRALPPTPQLGDEDDESEADA